MPSFSGERPPHQWAWLIARTSLRPPASRQTQCRTPGEPPRRQPGNRMPSTYPVIRHPVSRRASQIWCPLALKENYSYKMKIVNRFLTHLAKPQHIGGVICKVRASGKLLRMQGDEEPNRPIFAALPPKSNPCENNDGFSPRSQRIIVRY